MNLFKKWEYDGDIVSYVVVVAAGGGGGASRLFLLPVPPKQSGPDEVCPRPASQPFSTGRL